MLADPSGKNVRERLQTVDRRRKLLVLAGAVVVAAGGTAVILTGLADRQAAHRAAGADTQPPDRPSVGIGKQ